MRPVVKRRDPAFRIRFHEVRVQRMVVGMHQERRIGPAVAMPLPEPLQIHVHQRVAIEHEKVLGQGFKPRQHRPRRAQRLAFHKIPDFDPPPAAVA